MGSELGEVSRGSRSIGSVVMGGWHRLGGDGVGEWDVVGLFSYAYYRPAGGRPAVAIP